TACPDFVRLAEAYGARGIRVETPEQLDAAFETALARRDGPTIIDCIIEEEENVFPMIPAGKTVKDILLGPPKGVA
ncbi:MAG: thiamine pyrophosphate-dependent enzyme, partial [Armatimonadota bacterium]